MHLKRVNQGSGHERYISLFQGRLAREVGWRHVSLTRDGDLDKDTTKST